MTVKLLPTRKQVSDWLDEFADTGVELFDLVVLRQTLVPMYADGRLIDGQTIADAWNDDTRSNSRETTRGWWPKLAVTIEDALTEGNNDAGN